MAAQIKTQLLNALIVRGCAPVDSSTFECTTAIAHKSFETAVGVKEAHFYLAPADGISGDLSLSGTYYSEGNNVIEAVRVFVSAPLDLCGIVDAVLNFMPAVEKRVNESYARRMFLNFGAAGSV